MARLITTLTIGALAALALSGCAGASAPTFTKDATDDTPITISLSAIDIDENALASGDVTVLGDDANAMEVLDWFFEEKGLAFEQDNGLISTIGDLAGDQNQGWLIYVNDTMAEVGAEELIPADGDLIELRYVDYASAF
ncbi:DUF4430 domain-containing protein [Leifsonia sp. H3M29-4]|uniref:DUF4430 domain-containing protein n=1 Tax=Salinibacterium metalliresistens TaxID=3031321 RepID=UPI0023DA16E0|nr:DUF4430 domain-containing protein [Salinibacterium metalliresistens]MDF1479309.1 DUF4430 domain-containing protein [Salinibacterium metalliresistens]